jgi:chitosanase
MKEAGSDPVMQEIQDEAFETGYWRPMQEEARKLGLKMPLTIAMVYHQAVHMGISSAQTMAEEASASAGGTPAQGIDEHDWAKAFLLLRLRLTDRVQMQGAHGEFFGEMIEKGNWNLDPPLIVNGVTIAD